MRYAIVDLETVGIDTAAEYVEPSSAPGNYKDPKVIADYIAKADAEKVLKAGLDPDLARIVCLGWQFSDSSQIHVISCRSEEAEANTLAHFWAEVRAANLITFNGLRFDLPMLMRRSLYLGVKAPVLNLDKYRSPHVDLMNRLSYNGAITAHSLEFYAKRLGLPLEDDTSGADIAGMVTAGQWEAIEAHCRHDVRLTYAIAERLGVIELAAETERAVPDRDDRVGAF